MRSAQANRKRPAPARYGPGDGITSSAGLPETGCRKAVVAFRPQFRIELLIGNIIIFLFSLAGLGTPSNHEVAAIAWLPDRRGHEELVRPIDRNPGKLSGKNPARLSAFGQVPTADS
jgi:hypothetical protein